MSRRKARFRKQPPASPVQAPNAAEPLGEQRAAPAAKSSGWRVWLERISLIFLGPLVAFLLLEGGLRLFGYGYPTTFFIKAGPGEYITNEKFAWQFSSPGTALKPFLFRMAAKKPAGVVRICVLGESAAKGTPDPAYSFGRILEAQLRQCYPDKQFELINAAMRGIDSHVIRLIARECARHEMDVFVVYMGNNDVNGLHAPDPASAGWTQSLWLIRTGQWVRATRLGQLMSSLVGHAIFAPNDREAQDMAYFRKYSLRADDWRREKNRANFRANLEDICRTAVRSGAKVFVSTVGVNLRDCPPLESLHRAGITEAEKDQWEQACAQGSLAEANGQPREALPHYLTAARIDDHFAELHFRLGRCFLAAGDDAQARKHFTLALDWDAMQFRTDSPMNEVTRAVAAAWQTQGVVLVDSERLLRESALSDHGIPGEKLFHDHVHPSFAGNYVIARSFFDKMATALGPALGRRGPGGIPAPQECADAVAYTLYDELNVIAAMVRLTGRPPFLDQLDHAQRQKAAESDIQKRLASFTSQDADACLKTYQAALNRQPGFWPTHFSLASLHQDLGRHTAAAEQFLFLTRQFPQEKQFRLAAGAALEKAGDRPGALGQFQAALRLAPDDKDIKKKIQELQRGQN